MKNCKDCGVKFIGLSPKSLAQREYCHPCMVERRKRRQKEYICRTKYNQAYAEKHYHWKRETHLPVKDRICLVHGGPFKSTGPGNRICQPCKNSRGDLNYELVPKKVFVS